MDFETETFVTHSLRAEGFDASEDGTGRGIPLVPVMQPIPFDTTQITSKTNRSQPKPGSPCHPLASGAHPPAIAFNSREDPCVTGDISGSLGSSSPQSQSIVFNLRGREHGSQPEIAEVASIRSASGGSSRSYVADMAVRRLTVVECARLQGFSDLHAHVQFGHPRKISADEAEYLLGHGIECWQKGEQWMTSVAADGNMYRAYGNSMAVPVMVWIGQRIQLADSKLKEGRA